MCLLSPTRTHGAHGWDSGPGQLGKVDILSHGQEEDGSAWQ